MSHSTLPASKGINHSTSSSSSRRVREPTVTEVPSSSGPLNVMISSIDLTPSTTVPIVSTPGPSTQHHHGRRHQHQHRSSTTRRHQVDQRTSQQNWSMGALEPYHWTPIPPQVSNDSHSILLRSTPQIVLQNPGAMVVYDPPAHELVVYQHPPATASATRVNLDEEDDDVRMNGNESPFADDSSRQLLPFNSMYQERDLQRNEPRFCRLCHRPFGRWDRYAPDPDEYADDFHETGGLQHFTSNDYFHLLAASEAAADASREHSSQATSEGEGEGEDDAASETSSRTSRRDSRRRATGPARVIEVDEQKEKKAARNTRGRRATTAGSTPVSTPPSSINDTPIHNLRNRGVHIRRESGPATTTPSARTSKVRISTSSSTDDLTQQPAVETPSASASVADDDEIDEVKVTDLVDEDEVLDCGLKRSSFNNGYYAKFFREECKLGSGGVGGVYLTHHVLDNVMLGTYAVKKIPVGNSRPWLLQVLKEVRALEGLHHRHIVAYKHSWLESFKPSDFGPEVPCLFLLMEYANRGTLHGLIWPKVPIGQGGAAAARRPQVPQPNIMSEEDVWAIFIGTLLGLRHLHRAGVIHRDLKPENLLLTSEVDALGREHGLRVLVSDFGNAILKGVPYARTGNTGTLAYSAPETLVPQHEFARFNSSASTTGTFGPASSPISSFASSAAAFGSASSPPNASQRLMTIAYDEKCDLWSCGVILYAMAFGKLPFMSNSPEALFAEIKQQEQSTRGLGLPSQPVRSPEMLRMIRELLSFDPAQRPSLDDLLNRPAILQRREQRYMETQQFRNGIGHSSSTANIHSSGSTSLPTESYRPPASNSLVISPLLTSSSTPVPPRQRARSVSPAPMSLPPPSESPSSVRATSLERVPRGSNTAVSSSSSSASNALVLSRISLVDEEALLSPGLHRVRVIMDRVFNFIDFFIHRVTGQHLYPSGTCWRCEWNLTFEAMVHLVAFMIKLWLGLVVLLRRPTQPAIYGHIFPEVIFTLLLMFTSVLTQPTRFLTIPKPTASKHPILKPIYRIQRWFTRSPGHWQLFRLTVSILIFLLSLYWLLVSDSSLFFHLANSLVCLFECTAILSTFFATHPSHTSSHRQTQRTTFHHLPHQRESNSPTRSRSRGAHIGSAPNQTNPATNRSRVSIHPLSQVVARVPLLLPPTPVPTDDPPSTDQPIHRSRIGLIDEGRRLR